MLDLVAHQFPASCHGRFAVLHDDLTGAGLGFTAKMIIYVLITVAREGRILIEARSSRRWCSKDPGTLQCYYQEWSNCSLSGSRDVKNVSLRLFHQSKRWYGMGHATRNLQPAAHALLFRPRPYVEWIVDQTIERCGGSDYWTVHIRDSPEKRKERGSLPPVDAYLKRIPPGAKRILWQTANPHVFNEVVRYSQKQSFHYCHTNFTRHVNDVWRDPGFEDEVGLTGAVNGELGRRGIGLISLETSMWTWFLSTGTNMPVLYV